MDEDTIYTLTDEAIVPTPDALLALGFQPDPTAIAYEGPVLISGYSNFKRVHVGICWRK